MTCFPIVVAYILLWCEGGKCQDNVWVCHIVWKLFVAGVTHIVQHASAVCVRVCFFRFRPLICLDQCLGLFQLHQRLWPTTLTSLLIPVARRLSTYRKANGPRFVQRPTNAILRYQQAVGFGGGSQAHTQSRSHLVAVANTSVCFLPTASIGKTTFHFQIAFELLWVNAADCSLRGGPCRCQ